MKIHQLAAHGDLDTLSREFSNLQPYLEARDSDGHTPLMVAVASEHASTAVLKQLVDWGADVNAVAQPTVAELEALNPDVVAGILGEVDESVRAEYFEESSLPPAVDSVLSYAVSMAHPDKVRFLLDAGADPSYVDGQGYSLLLKAVYRSQQDVNELQGLLQLLVEAGAPKDVESSYGESAIGVASYRGDFRLVEFLLQLGCDAALLEWSPLFQAIADGDSEVVIRHLKGDWHCQRDAWERTPFLLSVHAGHIAIAEELLQRGSSLLEVGRGETTALEYALSRDDAVMVHWLLERGVDIEAPGSLFPPLLLAVENNALSSVRVLLEAGADPLRRTESDSNAMRAASTLEMVRLLASAGADLRDVSSEVRCALLPMLESSPAACEPPTDKRYQHQVFGKRNPTRMNNPFWDGMVRSRESAHAAAQQLGEESFDREAIWCFQRFGQSLTELPDGRWVEIGGEHEDFYDPDFCIYNDVVVHAPDGSFEIWGYPDTVFAPTDFHSVTWVSPYLYLVGCLGYPAQRRLGETQVMRLHTSNWAMEPLSTTGENPGWIHDHQATLISPGEIQIEGGKVDVGPGQDLVDNRHTFVLHLASGVWRRLHVA